MLFASCQREATLWPMSDGWLKLELCNGIIITAIAMLKSWHFVTTWMDPEDIMFSEITQAKKDKYCIIYVTFKRTSEYNKTGKQPARYI